ncbi:flagellar type III secretion system protein FlhB [Phaeovulum vinaykumarii]|uniref:Flagellar biosynthetic protein FlhB n=1 Tax=Phaeovulum vinaykumarii TaxID=407234 RepID=A0A1N7KVB2_9RHOB|nr:flagellar type III secretion system protein FlhB [Phaeovulum vinaykumarii]SIS65426.1 flagellar biosynthetic protein FlhB [Phaeovulum vinaykumarii]SOC01279.1 flagellar biosynthetic protein FlhB [Phaeovulum vinaykumarii]
MSEGGDDDDESKEHEPTERKLQEARKKGELVKSNDINVAASYGGLLIAALGLGAASLREFGSTLMVVLDQSDRLSHLFLADGSALSGGLIGKVLVGIGVWFVLPLVLVILSLVAQRAIVFAPEKLKPKLSRVNPISNAKQKFGRSGLFEFAKSFVKLLIIAAILAWFLMSRAPRVLMTQALEPQQVMIVLSKLILEFLFIVFIFAAVMGAIDYLWQRAEFLRRNRMSRKELMDEFKQSEGDPHLKSQRRQRAVEIATNQMLADVKKADVVIVNPTHYAVALQWQRGSGRAPVCVAKGVDEIAARIREKASEHGIPLRSDPPTARALYASVEIGQEIEPEHYKPVAAAIRFAEKMRRRAKERGAR